jgi:hypothetical protein
MIIADQFLKIVSNFYLIDRFIFSSFTSCKQMRNWHANVPVTNGMKVAL